MYYKLPQNSNVLNYCNEISQIGQWQLHQYLFIFLVNDSMIQETISQMQ